MNSHGEDSDDDEVFLDEDDVIEEILLDDEDLLDQDDDDDDDDLDPANETDDAVYVFRGHSKAVYTVACSPADFSLVVTGGKDDRAFLWKMGSPQSSIQLKRRHGDTVSAVAFNFNGLLIATGSLDGVIQVWDTSSGSFLCDLEGLGPESGGVWLKWHPSRNLILAGAENLILEEPENSILAETENSIMAGTEDNSVWMWDVADKGLSPKLFSGHESSVTCGDFTPNGNIICTGSKDKSLRIWNPQNGECLHAVKGYRYHTKGLTCLAITSNSRVAITGSEDGSIHLVNIETGKVIGSLDAHTDSVEYIAFSSLPNHSLPWAATGSVDGNLIIWDVQRSTMRCICDHEVASDENGVTCLAWLGTSHFIATGCMDGKVRVWDSSSSLGICLRIFNGHSEAIQSLAVCGTTLVSVSFDFTARVFDISEFLQH